MPDTGKPLSIINHDRDSAALRYVYPVVSRRAGGVSVGINLNTNNACNWRCIYCQVPDLTRGTAPAIDLAVLESELRGFLNELLHGDFMQSRVPEGARRINDIALSGNGEPTSSAEFVQVIELIARVRREVALPETVKTVLITNGSLLYRERSTAGPARHGETERRSLVQAGSRQRSRDAARQRHPHQHEQGPRQPHRRDRMLPDLAANLLVRAGRRTAIASGRRRLSRIRCRHCCATDIRPQGVLLYSLARPSLQAEAPRLSALSAEQLQAFADRISKLGLPVKVSP